MRVSALILAFGVLLTACGPAESPPGTGGSGGSGGAAEGGGGAGGTGGEGGVGGGCVPTPVHVETSCAGLEDEAIIIPPGLFYAQPLPVIEGAVNLLEFTAVVGKKTTAPNGVTYTCTLHLANEVRYVVVPAANTKPPLPNDPAWQVVSFGEPVTADVETNYAVDLLVIPFSVDATVRVWVMWQSTLESHQDEELQCLLGCTSEGADGFVSDDNGPWQADSTNATVEQGASGEVPCPE